MCTYADAQPSSEGRILKYKATSIAGGRSIHMHANEWHEDEHRMARYEIEQYALNQEAPGPTWTQGSHF